MQGACVVGVLRNVEDVDSPSIESDVERSSTVIVSSHPTLKFKKVVKLSQAALRTKKGHTSPAANHTRSDDFLPNAHIDRVEVCPASPLANGRSTDQSRLAIQADETLMGRLPIAREQVLDEIPMDCSEALDASTN